MAAASLILNMKKTYPDGAILQLVAWRLPDPECVRGSTHRFKYRLFYGVPGTRLLSYDNEAGKGDHVHRGAVEAPYTFISVRELVRVFLDEVRTMRGGEL
ncbi:hypothetical protein EOE48_00960 [Methylobacterium oryzihabitans]|uniref:Uncharacterized protein n=2 Tax=Methylobacterium oryzihabitans TaxID=2499852 RepID=A0A3S3UE69_9HYPH|nr:hypothetical protein EOE48_00960 [Methylobacterium oryzihabitans]